MGNGNAVEKACVVGVCLFAIGGLTMFVGEALSVYEQMVNFNNMGSYPFVVMAVGVVMMAVGIMTTVSMLLVIMLRMAFGKEGY